MYCAKLQKLVCGCGRICSRTLRVKRHAHDGPTTSSSLPREARVVVCGGGIAGLSVAYHLAKLGWKEILILEQGRLTSGTTWHAAGLIGQMRSSRVMTNICQDSIKLYSSLEEETGINPGFRITGSLALAESKERMLDLQRTASKARAIGIDCDFMSPAELEKMVPWMWTQDLQGALYIPGDCVTDPTTTSMALAKGARQNGVKIIEGVKVDKVETEKERVSEVHTNQGSLKCEYFINCAGMWSHELGLKCNPGVKVPLHPNEHQYLITKPIEDINPLGLPYIRDLDNECYIRDWGQGLMAGGFVTPGKPVFTKGIPYPAEFTSLPEDWDAFRPVLDGFLKRVPAAEKAEVQQLFNGPESFTPDMSPLIGPASEVDNYFVMAGFNSAGIAASGGAGKLLAEWIHEGRPSINTWPVDVRRFSKYHNNKKFLRDRVSEIEGLHYRIGFPGMECQSGRKLRCSPLYASHAASGAVFGERSGMETPKWFANMSDTEEYGFESQTGTFGKPGWFDTVLGEYWACRETVCAMDMSFFTKFELKSDGPEALELLQKLCPNEMDMPVGHVVHTGMLNEWGGYENDCSVARLAPNSFFMICPSFQLARGYRWIESHLPSDGSVKLQNVTHLYGGLNVMGPRAREVLQKLTETSLKLSEFKPFMCTEVDIGYASKVRIISITHTGEDGFVIYIRCEHALHVYDALKEAGRIYGIRDAGYNALRWLRLEKFYPYWGEDFVDDATPFEIGREHRVKFDKGVDFLGREALLRKREEGLRKHLAMFLIEDHDLDHDMWPSGGEPIFIDGNYTGSTTSTGYGPTLQKLVCLGWVTNIDRNSGEAREVSHDYVHHSKVEIQIGNRRFPAKGFLYPPAVAKRQISHV
ncbi:Pyruvate dehydrogenase phosphatase regulatory subunit, mitochondrial [Holothuria leucospilota]|uniref:Pyruvate dehydrogenase phosphatase regulatory subunit, mitochondrial n=1 Tax=Holothuria leucospilota TaxID=206669 RepID=A0A9Q1CB86_HOLLE|nr:Pyruvate dehydrogenase phosphatase regulatory subunit, mitochondrial [Holothuria leucospilota]